MRDGINLRGKYIIDCYRNGELLWTEVLDNIVTNEGRDATLDIMFNSSTQITAWYCALVSSDTAAAAGMTYATPTYTEFTDYSGDRPAYTSAAASSQEITNTASKAAFTLTDAGTLYGASIVGGGTDADTKGDTAGGGTLFSYSKFTTARSGDTDDVLNLTYELTS